MRSLNTLGLKTTIAGSALDRKSSTPAYRPLYGRVVKVIMSSDDPDWERYGCDQALYGVVYQKILDTNVEDGQGKGFAFCKHADIRRIPIKGEIVSLSSEFSVDLAESSQQHDAVKLYWTDIISIWNSPHLNAYPDQFGDEANKPADTGEYFKESGDIKPLMLCPGDLSIEGRYGQSVRMGGSTSEEAQEGISDKIGKPYVILRNGQPNLDELESDHKFKGDGPVYAVLEDINKDSASIYLTSDHVVPLAEAFTKRDACKGSAPEQADKFRGAQIVVNSDRVFINARNNDVEISAKEGAGIEAKVVYIDGKEYVAFDASKIYLGKGSHDEGEPVLKGRTSTEWLSNLCDQLLNLLNQLKNPAGGDSKVWISSVVGTAAATIPAIQSLQKSVQSLESKKVYTE